MEGRNLGVATVYDHDKVDILGVGVSAVNMDDTVATLEGWIAARAQEYVCVTGVHGVMESQNNERLRSVHNNAGMVTPDGMPLVWCARLMGKARTQRVYGPDLMRMMTSVSSQRGYRQFYYGGGEGVADQLAKQLSETYPGLNVVGTWCPPFREPTPDEDREVVDQINAARPDILWVGLSTPKQELWMAGHVRRLNVPVMIGVGAAFDFLAGNKRQAPLWMQRNGLEWLFRLGSEPRRLWRRYAYIVPGFLLRIIPHFIARAGRPDQIIRSNSTAGKQD